ncbi:MAG TPA: GAF domain-containing protein, partial [Myxococcota bacterium]|nr:GAF domain-containing protein [Myxococcota bacterium]
GTIRSRGAAVFVGFFVLLVAVCNMTFLPFYQLIPDGTAAASSVVFAGGGLIALLQRQRRSSSRREQLSLRWVILGLVVPALTLFPALVPGLPPTIQEFQISVSFPLSTMVVPLSIVHGLHPLSRFDLVRWVRFSTLGGMVVSAFALALAAIYLAIYPLLQRIGMGDRMPHLTLILVIVAAGLAFYFRKGLNNLVDILFFPMRLRAIRSVSESQSNLGDCWTVTEIDWCAKRALKGGFNATGAQVAVPAEDGWVDLVDRSKIPLDLTPEEQVLLRQGEGVEIVLDGDDGFTTQLLPLRSRGVFLGLLIAQPSEEARYTEWDRGLLRQIADAVAEAVWRCTRVQAPVVAANFSTREIMPKRLPTLPAH